MLAESVKDMFRWHVFSQMSTRVRDLATFLATILPQIPPWRAMDQGPYAKKVLTEPHPAKQTWVAVDPPPDLANSPLGPFLASRWEEIKMVLLLAAVATYCTLVYMLGYYGFASHALNVVRHAWDVVVIAILAMYVVPRKGRKLVRRAALAASVAVAVGRCYNPSLYPSFYPWQPATA